MLYFNSLVDICVDLLGYWCIWVLVVMVTLLKLLPAESFSLGLYSCSWASRMSTSCSIRRTEELTSPAKIGPLVCLANSLAKLAAFSPLRICMRREWLMSVTIKEDAIAGLFSAFFCNTTHTWISPPNNPFTLQSPTVPWKSIHNLWTFFKWTNSKQLKMMTSGIYLYTVLCCSKTK